MLVEIVLNYAQNPLLFDFDLVMIELNFQTNNLSHLGYQ